MLQDLVLVEKIMLAVFAFALAIQLFYFLFFFLRISFRNKIKLAKEFKPVSIIICARNEELNLKQNLPSILEQDYPNFEVVVVNDGSTDNTNDVLLDYSKNYKNLRITRIAEDQQFDLGKKLAVTVGVKAAKNETLLFIDADCKPVSDSWIKNVVSGYDKDTEIILGYGQYKTEKSFLNKIIRYDTVSIAMNYMGFAMTGIPYMGVGRNLSYKKSLFLKNKGFGNHYHLLSGDDDLFINETATKKNTKVVLSRDSFTVSEPQKTFKAWVKQKKRHLTTSNYYKQKHKFLLGLEPFSKFIFYLLFIVLLFVNDLQLIAISAFVARLITYLFVFKSVMRKLNEKYLLLISPLFEIILPIFYIFILYSNKLTGKKTKWK